MMDERSLQDIFSKLFPDEIASSLTQPGQPAGEQHSRAVELLKTAAGQAGGAAGEEINNFLNGSGTLLETTRAAAVHGSSAATTVADFLEKQLNLSPALARILAPLLVNLLPGIGKQTGSAATTKPKPRRKPRSSAGSKPKKPKSSASAKPNSHAKPKKPKSSASSKPKTPKSSTSSTPKKPKKSTSKKPAAKPKRTGRAGEIPES